MKYSTILTGLILALFLATLSPGSVTLAGAQIGSGNTSVIFYNNSTLGLEQLTLGKIVHDNGLNENVTKNLYEGEDIWKQFLKSIQIRN